MKVNFNRILLCNSNATLDLITSLVQCKICLNILNDPYDCYCCNQTFCKMCIVNYIETNKKCPYSAYFSSNDITDAKKPLMPLSQEEQSKGNLTIDKDQKWESKQMIQGLRPTSSNIVKSINRLKFACEYKKNGCLTELSIDEIDDHTLECKYKKGVLSSSGVTRKMMCHSTHFNNSNANVIQGSSDGLDGLSKSIKENKFKLHDSSMSFRKVELSDCSSPGLSGNYTQLQFNQRIMEKIDKMYEIISQMNRNVSIERKRSLSPNRKQSMTIEDNANIYNDSLRSSKKKIKEKKPSTTIPQPYTSAVSSLTSSSFSISKAIDNLTAKIDKITTKLSTVERIIQTTSSVSTQKYSIANEDLLSLTISSTPKKIFNAFNANASMSNTTNGGNTKYKTYNNNQIPLNQSITNSNALNNKQAWMIQKKKLLNVNENRLNMSMGSSNKPFQTINDTKTNKSPSLMNSDGNGNDINKIEELLNAKLNNVKAYIEEKCIDELKKYFLELTLDNSNLFVQKIDEIINLLPVNNTMIVNNGNTSNNKESNNVL